VIPPATTGGPGPLVPKAKGLGEQGSAPEGPAPDRDADATREFRDDLLRRTVAWCSERSAFYRERFAGVAGSFRGLEDLPRLPVLTRDEVAAHERELLCEPVQPACIQYTTGTTGTPLHLFRSPAEIAFIGKFYGEQVRERLATGEARPLHLSLTSAYHGQPTPVPAWAYAVFAGIYDRTQAQQARSLLEREFELPGIEPRITAVVGGDILVKSLTAYLVAAGVDLAALPVHTLVITGGYVSRARKRLLGDLWQARVQDRFSLSEVFGGALECGLGGPWIFDTEVVPEVVHPRTLQPIDRGIGALAMTGLYPFMQMMPLVRYLTGDLVEVAGHPDRGDLDLLVRFLGRARRSIVDAGGPEVVPLLLSSPLHDVVEGFPDIAATSRFADLGAGPHLELAGKLHYEVSSGPGTIDLRLGLRYPPWHYPERVTELITRLRQQLYQRFPELAERVQRGELALRVSAAPAAEVTPFNAK
jgi:phenylacetate-coenzyme A ligase PaaK-like adenylate-forming protein